MTHSWSWRGTSRTFPRPVDQDPTPLRSQLRVSLGNLAERMRMAAYTAACSPQNPWGSRSRVDLPGVLLIKHGGCRNCPCYSLFRVCRDFLVFNWDGWGRGGIFHRQGWSQHQAAVYLGGYECKLGIQSLPLHLLAVRLDQLVTSVRASQLL